MNKNELISSEIDSIINKNNNTVNIIGPTVHIDSHIQAIRTGKIIHPSLNIASSTSKVSTSKIPLSPNIKKKRFNTKKDTIVDEAIIDEKPMVVANLTSSIATITNILQVNDAQDRISEHKARFSDEIHRIKVNDEPAGLKRPHEERPPIFFAWPSAVTADSVPHIKNPPYAFDGNNSNEKWLTEYSESYSSLPSTFYSSVVIQKPVESHILNNEASGIAEMAPTPKKPKPSIDYTRAGMPSRKIPSIVIPSFFAWGPSLLLERDETDKGGKKVNIKPGDSSEDVIIKSDDLPSIDSEYNRMYISPPPDFIPRAKVVKRTPKSPIVLFTEFKPIESDGEGFLAVQSKKRPSAPLPPQFNFGDDISPPIITSLTQKEIVCSDGDGIESSRDFFIPIDNIKEKDNDSWVLVDNPIVTTSEVNWMTPSKQISQNKKQKIMTNRKKKVIGIGPVGSALTVTNLMTPQHFETVKKDNKPIKNILSISEYDAKFTNHFCKEGSNFVALMPKKKAVVVLKRKYDSSK
jgi:hypothetical protein